MKSNMSSRDKTLLTVMFIIVIVVSIGYWGIRPQLKAYVGLQEKIEKEVYTKKLNQQKITNLGFVEESVNDYEKKINDRKDEFFPVMTSSEVDRMMTEMALDEKLDIYDLSFRMPSKPTERLAYRNSELYKVQQQQIKDYNKSIDELEEDDEDDSDDDSDSKDDKKSKDSKKTATDITDQVFPDEEGYQPNTDIYAVPVTITVGGDLKNLEAFLDSVMSIDKRYLLTSYAWGEYREIIRYDADGRIISAKEATGNETEAKIKNTEDGVKVEIVTKKSLTVSLELYMCDMSIITASETDAESTLETDE